MPYVPTWKERLEEAQPYVMPVVAGALVLGLAGWLVWHELVPHAERKPAALPKEPAALMAARQQAVSEAEVAEKIYRRSLEAGDSEAMVAAQLDRAIAKQRDVTRLEPQASTAQTGRLAALEAERGSLRARAAAVRSVVLEREAEVEQRAGHTANALGKIREALQLQRDANANATSPELRDLPRETRLSLAIASIEAEPLHATVDVSLTLAKAAAARDGWDDAIKAYGEARAAQAELNQRYPGTRFVDAAALGRIDAEIDSLKAAGAGALIATREREAEAAMAAGRTTEAATLFAAAADLQADLNAKYPRSRLVSAPRVEQLRVKRDTVSSSTAWAQAAELDRELTIALRRRQVVVAGEKIAAAAALVEKTAADYPRSQSLSGALQRKLAYLMLRRSDLAALQEQVLTWLMPLPGMTGWRMGRTEVTQELYTRVMNTNPSRNPGRALPVDSVSWDEAQEFCQRLTWLLGLHVRLPTEAEFRAARGEGAAGAWSVETSAGRSHEAGKSSPSPAGFYDLAGNLAEWLQPPTDAGEVALVAGGSYLDAAGALDPMPIVRMEKRERARQVGFRVVADLVGE